MWYSFFMKSRIHALMAEYLVLGVGLVLFYAALERKSFYEEAVFLVTGGMLTIFSLAIGKTLKRIIQKTRPEGHTLGTYAFPSSHATGLAAVTYYIYTSNSFLGTLSLLLTLCVAYARIKTRQHDTWDIVGGFVIGFLVAFIVTPYIFTYVRGFFLPTFL